MLYKFIIPYRKGGNKFGHLKRQLRTIMAVRFSSTKSAPCAVFFSTLTNRPIPTGSSIQVLTAIEVESKEQADKIVRLTIENGGTRYLDRVDHGWMYYDSFADLDGHQREVMYTDPSKMP